MLYFIAIVFLCFLSAFVYYYLNNKEPHPTQLFLFTIINHLKIKIYSMELQTQQFVNSILGLVDKKTGEEVPATFDNIVLTSSDPSIFTADSDVNADGTIDVVGIAEGTATLTVAADATYVNSLGNEVTTPEEAKVDVTVTAPPPEADETDLVVTFGTPQKV